MPTDQTAPSEGSIVVTGTGRVAVTPDVADLRLGVVVTRPTVDAARSAAATTMAAILAAIDGIGVARHDVRTALVSVQPQYDYRDGKAPALTGYEINDLVEVTVRDLERVGDVIDGTLGAGATRLDDLSFRLADPTAAERDARLRAMAAARARADILAEAADLRITGVTGIVEGGAAPPIPMPRMKAERMAMAADVATPIEAGTMEVAVTVTVTYRTT